MTREEAIKYAEDRLGKGLYRLDLGYLNRGLYQITAREVDFMRVAIAALRERERVAEVGKTSCWISVEERLPVEAVRVLVRLSGDKPPIGEPRMDTDRVVDGRWVRWFDLVTHWMPLPEPPKEET